MSQPIRYGLADADLGRIFPREDGHLVMHSDYAALAAENERLTALTKSTLKHNEEMRVNYSHKFAEIEAENERLRKAGENLAETMEANGIHDNGCVKRHCNALAVWAAAKEGSDAK